MLRSSSGSNCFFFLVGCRTNFQGGTGGQGYTRCLDSGFQLRAFEQKAAGKRITC